MFQKHQYIDEFLNNVLVLMFLENMIGNNVNKLLDEKAPFKVIF